VTPCRDVVTGFGAARGGDSFVLVRSSIVVP
jgi:hypothetical protein